MVGKVMVKLLYFAAIVWVLIGFYFFKEVLSSATIREAGTRSVQTLICFLVAWKAVLNAKWEIQLQRRKSEK